MPLPLRHLLSQVFIVLTLCTASVCAADSRLDQVVERGALILGTSGNMPSMNQVGEDGKAVGFDVDLARIMADMMGVELQVRVMPFAKLLDALDAGEVDVVISNMTITPRRNLQAAFVGPYLTSGKCVVTKDEAVAKATESMDLNTSETRLAVLAGSTSEEFARELFPQATIVPVDDYQAAAGLVAKDEAHGLLTDYPICVAVLKANPDAGFVSVFSLLTYEPIGIALPAEDTQFINWTENFLQRMKGTKGLDELARHWFGKFARK